MSQRTVTIITLGCKVNQCDSGSLSRCLSSAGLRLVGPTEKADVCVVNTCSVTQRANAESRQLIRRLKARNPQARMIVTGCYATTADDELGRLQEVDLVVGIGCEEDLLEAAGSAASSPRAKVATRRRGKLRAQAAVEGHSRAFLKVQEGCDLGCSFCIVPKARGHNRSVPSDDVLRETDDLAARGFEEVVLCGPNLGGWGRDFGPRLELADLVEAVCQQTTVARIRLSSINPNEFSERLIETIAANPLVCPHLHIPIQAGDDRILSLMRRRHDRGLVEDLLGRLVARQPDITIGTDVIVGFPGEDNASFALTQNFLASLPLGYLHVFPFSPRRATPAARLPERPAGLTVRARVAALSQLGNQMRQKLARRFLGRVIEVLVETKRDKTSGLLRGYSSHYVRLLFAGSEAHMNRRVWVKAERLGPGGSLLGTLAENGKRKRATT